MHRSRQRGSIGQEEKGHDDAWFTSLLKMASEELGGQDEYKTSRGSVSQRWEKVNVCLLFRFVVS